MNKIVEKVVWERTKVYTLIGLVKAHPELWNKTNNYKNRDLKRNSLEAIAEILGFSVDVVKTKLHNLRCQLNTEIRKIKKKKGAGTKGSYTSRWEFFEAIKFMSISPSMESSKGVGSRVTDAEDLVEVLTNEEETRDPQEFHYESLRDSASKRNKRKRIPSGVNQDEQIVNKPVSMLPPSKDDFDIFGEFVASELRGIRSERFRKKLKRSIQEAILEITAEEDVENSMHTPTSPDFFLWKTERNTDQ